MKHRTLTVALVGLLALTAACSTNEAPEAPSPLASAEITAEATPEGPTKAERIEAAQEAQAERLDDAPRPGSKEEWLAAFDTYWSGLDDAFRGDLCDSWRTLGRDELHELIEAPDVLAKAELQMKFQDVCAAYPE